MVVLQSMWKDPNFCWNFMESGSESATNVFKMKEIVGGRKKTLQEPHAVLDTEANELVASNAEVRRVTLKHCMDTFKKENPHEDVEVLVNMVNKVHDERMTIMDNDEEEHTKITKEEFDGLVKKLEKKNKRSYDNLTMAGERFKTVVYKLCKRLIEAEIFPARFYETVLHQL